MKIDPLITLAAFAALSIISPLRSHAVNLEFVTVGDPGNPNDPTLGYGSVAEVYSIGKFEVSLIEYTAFLNSVAATDSFSLWSSGMQTNLNIAGIARAGSTGSFSYSVIGDGNRPVTYMSWFDSARFVNWLHNGQPTGPQGAGTTESGAYTLNGATSGVGFTKNANALYWIPSENEWYKAALYDPSASGPADDYWLYPTRSDSAPGNQIGAAANQANFRRISDGVYSVTQSSSYSSSQNYLTPGGSYSASGSYYGTFDQGGNVWEWNDAVIGSWRGVRGGRWEGPGGALQASARTGDPPSSEDFTIGFRVATVPEPTVAVSLLFGFGLLIAKRKRP